ncbi:hypothetical protein, partial [Aeromonas media]|uniref:hypothetical protein n=1 Tax=Aeromonas media TaxID=651 RepID=UPI003D197873
GTTFGCRAIPPPPKGSGFSRKYLMIYDIIVRDKHEDGFFVLERLNDDVIKSMVKERRASRDLARQESAH